MAAPAPPLIGKWISTRKTGPVDNGPSMPKLGLKDKNVAAFAKALNACPRYSERPIYRGVFRDDPFYRALLRTERYYSFAKTKEWGEAYSDKIVLVVATAPAYDIFQIQMVTRIRGRIGIGEEREIACNES